MENVTDSNRTCESVASVQVQNDLELAGSHGRWSWLTLRLHVSVGETVTRELARHVDQIGCRAGDDVDRWRDIMTDGVPVDDMSIVLKLEKIRINYFCKWW